MDRWKNDPKTNGNARLEDFLKLQDAVMHGISPQSSAGSTVGSQSRSPACSYTADPLFYAHKTGRESLAELDAKGTVTCVQSSDVHLLGETEEMLRQIDDIWKHGDEWCRPHWDTYFMRLAFMASSRSNCMKRRVGAVLVNIHNRVMSTGYNGTVAGTTDCNKRGPFR
eukprot:GHVN01003824.1.p1 GENE.GHVN01003824.1~~GHVN01003824.1.p1  ORF type:complete len:181 (-),score=12.13 GHVN01003824.1:148-651(-)